ncbi:MAG: hypothetical protein H7Z41_16430 [Cytophagales bacterium]|nr:hypothetical protein [Armatimonadota bacterium]
MRTLSTFVAASALTIGLATASQAQTPVNPLLPTTGTREIGLSGTLNFEPSTDLALSVKYGRFQNQKLEFGGYGTILDPERGDSTYSVGAFADYHFPGASPLLPFIGLSAGYANTRNDGTFAYGVQGGVKYFVNSNVAATGQLVYRDYTQSGVGNEFRLELGLAVYLR